MAPVPKTGQPGFAKGQCSRLHRDVLLRRSSEAHVSSVPDCCVLGLGIGKCVLLEVWMFLSPKVQMLGSMDTTEGLGVSAERELRGEGTGSGGGRAKSKDQGVLAKTCLGQQG